MVAESGVTLLVGHAFRRLGAARKVKQLLDTGVLGTVVLAEANWTLPSRLTPEAWRYDRERGRGGPLIQLGIHHADTLAYWLGPVARSFGSFARVATEAESEDDRFYYVTADPDGEGRVEDVDGELRAYSEEPYDKVRWTFAPPVLHHEGFKLQPAWFYSFLLDPVPLREQIRGLRRDQDDDPAAEDLAEGAAVQKGGGGHFAPPICFAASSMAAMIR